MSESAKDWNQLYCCSPDEVVFLTTRDAYEPYYVDDRKYFELNTFYPGSSRTEASAESRARRQTERPPEVQRGPRLCDRS